MPAFRAGWRVNVVFYLALAMIPLTGCAKRLPPSPAEEAMADDHGAPRQDVINDPPTAPLLDGVMAGLELVAELFSPAPAASPPPR
jgi:hypothetical protein